MASFDVHQVVVQFVAGIGAMIATGVTSVVGLVRRRPVWLYVAAICILGPSYFIAGLSDSLIIVGVLAPALCIASGMALKYDRTAVAAILMIPVYVMFLLFLLMYVSAAGS
ncbi:cell wall arabinan synthesis protein [Thermaerobacter sp. PB12/4term]|uniref:cell wall arabinan synthesis protein n=1 Tax=Thermaerobacter sp. PB12/4term TaxID=2293838 RepID=UPI000E3287A7|nr:cell wall arabinan synthesis protein [Thermaerobacter sp. PB12/4term]QIA27713.1 cell wall arabinan synthesis protein [Thermaerobacter sp. PB12/4term]